jgi:hypothetical protein
VSRSNDLVKMTNDSNSVATKPTQDSHMQQFKLNLNNRVSTTNNETNPRPGKNNVTDDTLSIMTPTSKSYSQADGLPTWDQ